MTAALAETIDAAVTREAANDLTVPAPGSASLLRFITCGSVDDGKSTLIGRLLFEAGAVFSDQMETLERDSRKFGTQGEALDYALLVDGLAAEREQGITIDVAYRYFATPRRAFIVADTPGHEQFTRNMATGASIADLAVILVDARKGILPQTRRHAFIVSALGVRDVIVAINKMDLIGFDRAAHETIVDVFRKAALTLGFTSMSFVPVCARDGDNIASRSPRMSWYQGAPLLAMLEEARPAPQGETPHGGLMPVQWVNRPNADFRGYSGTLAHGHLNVGDIVKILPSQRSTRIARILGPSGDLVQAVEGQSVTLTLTDEIDIARGDVIVSGLALEATRHLHARLIWTGEAPLDTSKSYEIKLGSRSTLARIAALEGVIDVETYATAPAKGLAMNGIGLAQLHLDAPLVATPYAVNRELGGFILIDRLTHETAAFGLIMPASERAHTASPGGLRQSILHWLRAPGHDQALTWRIGSALLVAALVFSLSGSWIVALAAGAADAALRVLLRRVNETLWARLHKRRGEYEAGAGI